MVFTFTIALEVWFDMEENRNTITTCPILCYYAQTTLSKHVS